jgi:hypothetical protein
MNLVKHIITLPMKPSADLVGREKAAVVPIVLVEIFVVSRLVYHAFAGIISGLHSL